MKRGFLFGLIAVVVLLMGVAVFAQTDDEGNPNDPSVNERANACYDGGVLEGKCDSELEWQAGWYLIRYLAGIFTREEIPSWVAWVLADETLLPIEEDEEVVSICAGPIYGSLYVLFNGTNVLTSPTTAYYDANCTVTYTALFLTVVYAPNSTTATNLCIAQGGFNVAASLGNDVYYCTNT